MRISIITPVYNAAATLRRCLDSLAAQTYKEMEIVLVDDCSRDDSMAMLQEFAASRADVKLIHHEVNRGVANARNTGLDAATGDYVYFLDADDWLEPDALEQMARKASEGMDIVGCEWRLAFEKSERMMSQPDFGSPLEAMQQMMYGRMRWNLWLFMVRRELYEGIRFVPGQDMGEDMLVMHRLFMRASRVGLVQKHLYHYAQPNLSSAFSEKLISQVSANVSALEAEVRRSSYSEQLLPLMPYLKLNIKLPLLMTADRSQYRRWMEWWPEANASAMSNPALPVRTRLLQWCASKRLWAVVWLYDMIVTKFLYGVIYK